MFRNAPTHDLGHVRLSTQQTEELLSTPGVTSSVVGAIAYTSRS